MFAERRASLLCRQTMFRDSEYAPKKKRAKDFLPKSPLLPVCVLRAARRAAVHSNTLQQTATRCNTLQHAATQHCNTLQQCVLKAARCC